MTSVNETGRTTPSRSFIRIVAIGLMLMFAAPVTASSEQPTGECVPSTPRAAVGIIETYLDAFIDHSPEAAASVPLAPNVRRTSHPPVYPRSGGGPVYARSSEEVRLFYTTFWAYRFLTEYGGLRVFVDECNAVAFLWLHFEIPGALVSSSHPMIRFRISGGLIEQIELLDERTDNVVDGMCWPATGDPAEGRTANCPRLPTTDPIAPDPDCSENTPEDLMQIGGAYLESLNTRDASQVPLAESARRSERPAPAGGGPVTGTSGAEIRGSIEHASRYDQITNIRDIRWVVEPQRCEAIAFSLVDVDPIATRHQVTRFRISGGLIYEIESASVAPVQPGALEGSCWPQTWSDALDETFRLHACAP